jgi:hypothetical protein
MMTKGYPELQQLYEMLGAKENVTCTPLLHFPHNYNYVTRALMYSWFNKHLKLGLPEPIVEEDYLPLSAEEHTVWDAQHPRPAGGDDYERSLTKWLDDTANCQMQALVPTDADSLAKYHQVVGGAFDVTIGRSLSGVGELEREEIDKREGDSYRQVAELVTAKAHGEELPVVSLEPKTEAAGRKVVIWVDGTGKAALLSDDGSPCPEVRRLVDAGWTVVIADLLYQGEFLADGQPLQEARVVGNPRQYAGYTFGYNPTLFAHRAHDILTLIAHVRSAECPPKRVAVLGTGAAGPWAAAALAQAGAAVDCAAIDTGGFRFVDLDSYRDVNFLPGAVKYGDVPALLALSAPRRLWLAGEAGKVPQLVAAAYDAVGSADHVFSFAGEPKAASAAAVQWLIEQP